MDIAKKEDESKMADAAGLAALVEFLGQFFGVVTEGEGEEHDSDVTRQGEGEEHDSDVTRQGEGEEHDSDVTRQGEGEAPDSDVALQGEGEAHDSDVALQGEGEAHDSFAEKGDDTALRRSRRVPKPKVGCGDGTPNYTFRYKFGDSDSSDSEPTTPRSSLQHSTQKKRYVDTDDVTPEYTSPCKFEDSGVTPQGSGAAIDADVSLEIVVPGPSNVQRGLSNVQPGPCKVPTKAQLKYYSNTTPTKKSAHLITHRRSSRVPKPKNQTVDGTPDYAFCFQDSSPDAGPAAPNKAKKKVKTGGKPKSTEEEDSGPSPYKSSRPKYLPKNVKVYNKKRLARQKNLAAIQKIDDQVVKLVSKVAKPECSETPVQPSGGDVLGTRLPHFVFLRHESCFSSYDEHTFESKTGHYVLDLMRSIELHPQVATVNDCKVFAQFLTVTSKKLIFDHLMLVFEENAGRLKFVLSWEDLKDVLKNLGLGKQDIRPFEAATYNTAGAAQPKRWNFEFLFRLIELSFRSYSQNRLLRLVKFLAQFVFDRLAHTERFQHKLLVLVRNISKHLLQIGAKMSDLLRMLNLEEMSWICTRMLIQHVSLEAELMPLGRIMAYRAIHGILGVDFVDELHNDTCRMLTRVGELLGDINGIRAKTTIQDIYQLIILCELLVVKTRRVPFDANANVFIHKLAEFAEKMLATYTGFEQVTLFTDTVQRVRVLASMDTC